jgi:hypothetical protein
LVDHNLILRKRGRGPRAQAHFNGIFLHDALLLPY